MDRKIVAPGHEISVKITGPRSKYQYKANDNGDGTYYVTFTPESDGNHVIEVGLNGTPIGSSPFHVTVLGQPKPLLAKPKPYWYYQDIYETKDWFPFPSNENDLIEKQFEQYHGGVVNINEFKIDITKREQINTVKRHIIHLETKPILRSTWFWEDDNGKLIPYNEEICAILETAYQEKNFNKNVVFALGKKTRYVAQFPDGSFKQYRQASDASTKGRKVERGFLGQLVYYEE